MYDFSASATLRLRLMINKGGACRLATHRGKVVNERREVSI